MESSLVLQNTLYIVLIASIVVLTVLISINLYHLIDVLRRFRQISQRIDRITILADKEAGRLASFIENTEMWLTGIVKFLSQFGKGRSRKK